MTHKNSPGQAGGLTEGNRNNLAVDSTPSLAARQYNIALAWDVLTIDIAGALVGRGIALPQADRERVALAVSRVRAALYLPDGGQSHG